MPKNTKKAIQPTKEIPQNKKRPRSKKAKIEPPALSDISSDQLSSDNSSQSSSDENTYLTDGEIVALYDSKSPGKFTLATIVGDVLLSQKSCQAIISIPGTRQILHFYPMGEVKISTDYIIDIVPECEAKSYIREKAKTRGGVRQEAQIDVRLMISIDVWKKLADQAQVFQLPSNYKHTQEPEDEENSDQDQEDDDAELTKAEIRKRKKLKVLRAKDKQAKLSKFKSVTSKVDQLKLDKQAAEFYKKGKGKSVIPANSKLDYKIGKFNALISIKPKHMALESKDVVPNFGCSVRTSNKELIRAAYTKNQFLFSTIIDSKGKISRLNQTWGPELNINFYTEAFRNNQTEMLIKVFNKIEQNKFEFGNEESCQLKEVNTGFNSKYAYGMATRKVNMARGGREGNNAFVADLASPHSATEIDGNVTQKYLMTKPVSIQVLQTVLAYQKHLEHTLFEYLNDTLLTGDREKAAFFIERGLKNQGFGFNQYHLLALNSNNIEDFNDMRKTSASKKSMISGQFTPIHCACLNPNPAILEKLLSVSQEYLIQDTNRRKPVHFAACCETPVNLQLLSEKGSDTREVDFQKTTPLMFAAMNGRIQNVKYLLENDRSIPRQKNKIGYNALHYAAENNHIDILNILVHEQGIKIGMPGPQGQTALHLAAAQGHLEAVLWLIENGARVQSKDKMKRTPLIMACRNGNYTVCSALLQEGAPFDQPDSSKNYPLHYAAAYGWVEIIDLLVLAGADINAMNSWNINAITVAVLKNLYGPVQKLLEYSKTDVNCVDDDGRTLLANSLKTLTEKTYQQVEFLLQQKKADPNIGDLKGNTPLHNMVGVQAKSLMEARYLVQGTHPDEYRQGLEQARILYKKFFRLLVVNDADINRENFDGKTPLMLALVKKNFDAIQILLEEPSLNVQMVNKNGETLLHIFPSLLNDERTSEIFDKLFSMIGSQRKQSVNYVDDSGRTAIHKILEAFVDKYPALEGQILAKLKQDKVKEKNAILIQQQLLKGIQPRNMQSKQMAKRKVALKKSFVFKDGDEDDLSQSDQEDEQELMSDDDDMMNLGVSSSSNDFPTKKRTFHGLKGGARMKLTAPKSSTGFGLQGQQQNQVDHDGMVVSTSENQLLQAEASKIMSKYVNDFINILRTYQAEGGNFDALLELPKALRPQQGNQDPTKMDEEEFLNKIDSQDSGVNKLDDPFAEEAFEEKVDKKKKQVPPPHTYQNLLHIITKAPAPELVKYLQNEVLRDPNFQGTISFNQESYDGKTPLNYLLSTGQTKGIHEDYFSYLLQNTNIEIPDKNGSTCLLTAVTNSKFEFMQQLILKGARLDTKDQKGLTPLIHFCKTRNLEQIQALVQAGAGLNFQDNAKRAPLHWAVNSSSSSSDASHEIEDFLISKGADYNLLDKRQRTPLFYAFVKVGNPFENTQSDPIEIVANLIKRPNCLIDIKDIFGKSPLSYACQRGSMISALYLLKNKCQIDLKDMDGNTPLGTALLNGHQNIVIFLIQSGADLQQPVICVDYAEQKKQWRLFLDQEEKEDSDPSLSALNQSLNNQANMSQNLAILNMSKFQNVSQANNNLTSTNNQSGRRSGNYPMQDLEESSSDEELTDKQFERYQAKQQEYGYGGFGFGGFGFRRKRQAKKAARKRLYGAQLDDDEQEEGQTDNKENIFQKKERECSTFAVAIRKNWQGVVFLMLEYNFDLSIAILDCFDSKRFNYVYTLLMKESDPAKLVKENQYGQNITHLFAQYSSQIQEPLHSKILSKIEQLDISFSKLDQDQKQPIHYAASCGCLKHIQYLLQKQADPNKLDGTSRSVLAYLLQKNISLLNFKQWLIDFRFDLNQLFYDSSLAIEDNSILEPQMESPLTFLMLKRRPLENIRILIEAGADINQRNSRGWSCATIAIRQNKLKLLKQLSMLRQEGQYSKTSVIDFRQRDLKGWTLVHHCVKPLSFASYENENMLIFINNMGAPLNEMDQTADKMTPLRYAERQSSKTMYNALVKMGVPPLSQISEDAGDQEEELLNTIRFPQIEHDFEEDAEAFISYCQKIAEQKNISLEDRVLPDKNAQGKFEVVYGDSIDDKDPLDCSMVKVDIHNGLYSGNTFYVIQLLREKVRGVYVVFTRWGRVGDIGQHQQTPFGSFQEGKDEFCKIFKEKTGNLWQDRKDFQKVHKKYRPISLKQKVKVEKFLKEYNEKDPNNIQTQLQRPVQKFMRRVCNGKIIATGFQQHNINQDFFPLHLITKDKVMQAKSLLEQIKVLQEEMVELKKNSAEPSLIEARAEEISAFSSEFYEIIPQANYTEKIVPPISSQWDLANKQRMVYDLMYFEVVIRLLCAAQFRKASINQLDYCFSCMNFKIAALPTQSDSYQIVQQYIQNGYKDGFSDKFISRVFAVERKGEKDVMEEKWSHEKNRMLLWHGTKKQNLIGIMQNGFRIAPADAQKTGSMFGEGVYFADMFSKSYQYTSENMGWGYHHSRNERQKKEFRYMFLCEVVLGKQKLLNEAQNVTGLPNEKFQSVKGNGKLSPVKEENIYMPNGCIVPIGEVQERQDLSAKSNTIWGGGLGHNEFVVYDSSQVRVRYLVECRERLIETDDI